MTVSQVAQIDESRDVSHMFMALGIFACQFSGAYALGAILNDLVERYFSTGMWA